MANPPKLPPELPPEFAQPRRRSGLAKLRGDVSAPPPLPASSPETAPESAPDSAPDWAPQEPSGVVTLTKPEAELAEGGRKEPAREGPGRGVLVTAVALVVAIAALLALVLVNPFDSGSKSSSPGAGTGNGGTSDERLAVVRSARQFTVSFFTYDYRKIDTYFRRIEAASSGSFRKDFVSKEQTLKTVVTQLKTVATGQVPDSGAGLFQLNGDKATALIAANFNASNAVTKNGQKRYRVKIALQRVKGVWLVTNFDQVV